MKFLILFLIGSDFAYFFENFNDQIVYFGSPRHYYYLQSFKFEEMN